MESQFGPPDKVDAAADHVITPCPAFKTPTLCGRGRPPPATAVNVSPVCERSIVLGTALMVMVTGTATCSPVVAVIDTCPEYVPGPRPAGFAVTVSETCVLGV